MRIGIPKDYFGEGLDPEVKAAVLQAAKELEKKGAIVEEFDLSLVEYAIPAYYVIACAEASSNLARFDGVKYGYRTDAYEGLHQMYKKSRSEGFGAEVKRRIMLGSFVLSSGYYDAYYLKALRTKALIKKAFDEAFAKYDVILGPAAPTTAPELGKSCLLYTSSSISFLAFSFSSSESSNFAKIPTYSIVSSEITFAIVLPPFLHTFLIQIIQRRNVRSLQIYLQRNRLSFVQDPLYPHLTDRFLHLSIYYKSHPPVSSMHPH